MMLVRRKGSRRLSGGKGHVLICNDRFMMLVRGKGS